MVKRQDEGQQRLRVVTTIDDEPGKLHIDTKSGQAKILGIEQFLLPPEFKPFADFMNNRLSMTERRLDASTEQNRRLANSLETVIPKFIDQSVSHTNPDIVFGHLRDGEEADVAIADGANVPGEALYTLAAGEIADRIGNKNMSASRMANLLRDFQLFGNPKFHHTFKTSRKGFYQKYKPSVMDEIYRRLQQPEKYDIPHAVVAKYIDYIKPRGIEP